MIISIQRANIFQSPYKHIAFAINAEGYNDAGFAGMVGERAQWPELSNTGSMEMGSVISKQVGDIHYHGIVCHSLHNGWGGAREAIQQGMDSIMEYTVGHVTLAHNETVACVLMGAGMIGQMSGASVLDNLAGFAASRVQVAVYYV